MSPVQGPHAIPHRDPENYCVTLKLKFHIGKEEKKPECLGERQGVYWALNLDLGDLKGGGGGGI